MEKRITIERKTKKVRKEEDKKDSRRRMKGMNKWKKE
jgi:hypothetical protein